MLDLLDLLAALGFIPWLAPFRPNGKPLHVHGFLGRFERVAARNAGMLRALAAEGVPLVGLDPSMTLVYRSEYKALGADGMPKVQLVQEWLAQRLDELPEQSRPPEQGSYLLLPHCTERANAAGSLGDWQRVFRRFGLELTVAASGCCGMAGTYGHEARHRATSERIYALSWQEKWRPMGKVAGCSRRAIPVVRRRSSWTALPFFTQRRSSSAPSSAKQAELEQLHLCTLPSVGARDCRDSVLSNGSDTAGLFGRRGSERARTARIVATWGE